MKPPAGIVWFILLVPVLGHAQQAQTFRGLLTAQLRSATLPGPQHLRDHVADGKLRLSLHDAVVLMLENNSAIHVQEAQVEEAKFSVLRSYQAFDPQLQTVLAGQRTSYPGFSQVQGAGTFNDLNQLSQTSYTQMFQTGTRILVGLNSTKDSSNSGFYFLNPYYQSFLNLQVIQPLLRNRGLFANRAPVIIARSNFEQSRASFEAQVNVAVLEAITRYWELVRAHNNLEVAGKSKDAAEATYQHDKRALELGALPPLDIYRSESEVASRRVQAIEAEYAVRQAEDNLRLVIGADQDSYMRALDIDATETLEVKGELLVADAGTELQEALAKRPELRAWQRALESDEVNVRLAHNQLLPDLEIAALYQGSGVGGNFNVGQVMTRGGLGTSLNQLFGFGYPGYGGSLTLNLPIKRRAAQADLGSALAVRHRDLYSAQLAREQITLEVSNAVHQLEQAKLTLAAGRTALDLAQKMLAAEQRKAQLGSENIFFVLDAQTRLAIAEASPSSAVEELIALPATLEYESLHYTRVISKLSGSCNPRR
ncbi:MAG: TolC family protein [Acidobacteria bacterium]|nr:TolC family protein [Acidobacteriota bacterium]